MKQSRRLPLQALYNCRDLGGFPTADGGVTKYGVFLRSEAPCNLPQADLDALLDYGLAETIDLRGGGEVRTRPSDLSSLAGVTYHHKSLFNEAAVFDKNQVDKPGGGPGGGPGGPNGVPAEAQRSGFGGEKDEQGSERSFQPPTQAGNEDERTLRGRGGPGGPGGGPGGPGGPGGLDWGEQYKDMAESAKDWAREVLQIAADCPGALLYHCTTGKDRTGILTCYLLSIAGVSRSDIAADYCVSQVYLEPVYAVMRSGKMPGMPGGDQEPGQGQGPGGAPGGPGMDEGFFSTKAENMLKLIDYLTETYGGVVEYLKSFGVSEELMDRIRAKFVEN